MNTEKMRQRRKRKAGTQTRKREGGNTEKNHRGKNKNLPEPNGVGPSIHDERLNVTILLHRRGNEFYVEMPVEK